MFSCCQVVGLTWYNLRILTFTRLQVQGLGQANIQFPTGRIYLDSPPTQVKVHPIILGKSILEVFIILSILENELISDWFLFCRPSRSSPFSRMVLYQLPWCPGFCCRGNGYDSHKNGVKVEKNEKKKIGICLLTVFQGLAWICR